MYQSHRLENLYDINAIIYYLNEKNGINKSIY